MTYTLTPRADIGRFQTLTVVDSSGRAVATFTRALTIDPHGISGDGGRLEATHGPAMPSWGILLDAIGAPAHHGARRIGTLEGRTFEDMTRMLGLLESA